MNRQHSAKPASTPKTSPFSTLRGLLRGRGSGAPSHRRTPIVAPLALAVSLASAVSLAFAAPALAARTATTSAFGSPALTVGLTVDNSASASSGDVYATSFLGNTVFRLDPEGNKLGELGSFANPAHLAVDPANGDLYVSDLTNATITAFDPAGNQIFQVSAGFTPFGLAVDPNKGPHGTLYAGDQSNGRICELDPETGAGLGHCFGEGDFAPEAVQSLALDSSGDVYAVNEEHSVLEFNSAGTLVQTIDTEDPSAVAVDPANDRIFVAEGDKASPQIAEYAADPPAAPSPMPAPLEVFGAGEITSGARVLGLGVSAATNTVYLATFGGEGFIFPGEIGPTQPLRVQIGGEGAVSSSPSGIKCPSLACEADFGEGSTVTLTAKAKRHFHFAGWVSLAGDPGTCTATTSPCQVTLSEALELEAEFEEIPQQTLEVSLNGPGEVTSSPAGIACSEAASPCAEHFDAEGPESTVILSASHGERSEFAGWGAGQCAEEPSPTQCKVEMSEARAVSAEFTAIPQRSLKVSISGSGSLSGSLPGPEFTAIECPSTCEATYNQGATITLSAHPGPNFALSAWSGCTPLGEITAGQCEVSELNADAEVSATFAPLPISETAPPTQLTATSATLNGSVDPQGTTIEECAFEYVTQALYAPGEPNPYAAGQSAACETTPAGSGAQAVSAAIAGLEGSTTYHYRLLATNSAGPGPSPDAAFTTAPAPPLASASPATQITRTAATLNGSFDPRGSEASYRFAYVSAADYKPGAGECPQGNACPYAAGHLTPLRFGGTGSGAQPAAERIDGLKPATTYHFALLATGPGGAATGSDQTFTTAAAQPPAATTEPATGVGATSATLHGSLDANGLKTTYRFQIGTTTAYTTTLFGSAGEEAGEFEVALPIADLQPATTYHFRITATNADGTATGQDMTFTTAALAVGVLGPEPELKPRAVTPPPSGCRHGLVKRHEHCVKKGHRHHKRSAGPRTGR